jgi:hypothetical protein
MSNGAFTLLEIMGKTFSRRQKVLMNDSHDENTCSYDSTSVRQLGPDFENRGAQLVTHGFLVTRMNVAEHECFTQHKGINYHITYFTID